MAKAKFAVTVAILTFNGDRYLERILQAVAEQDFKGQVELLVIDSGSTDGTLAIVAAHPEVRLHEIPNSEFGHGRTRNLAAQLSNGEIVVYLTHDAVPADTHWLAELVAPFEKFPGVEGVVGRQIARPDCVPVPNSRPRSATAPMPSIAFRTTGCRPRSTRT
jgi:rhamnosyltransferase